MLKKIISAALALTLVFGATGLTGVDLFSEQAVITASAETYGDYEYEVLDDGTIEITGYTGNDVELTIPSTINGKIVSRIGDFAFERCTSLEIIFIPDGVTSIGYCAFSACTSLMNITIPDSLINIDICAFEWCYNLESIVIPDSVVSIGKQAFYACLSLRSIKLSNNLTSIDSETFWNCNNLIEITIPDSITSIKKHAFRGCTYLPKITITNNVTNIENEAFDGCDALVIYCYSNSFAHLYAIDNDIDYILLDAPEDEVVGSVEIPGIGNIPGMDITDIEITFTDENGEEYDATVTETGDIMLPMLPAGEYKVTASMENCPSRDYNITVESGKPLALDIELKLYGDISGDGKITAVDSAMVNAYVMKTGKLDDYDQKVADVIGNDGSVTAVDCSRINAHVQKTNLLW